MELLKYLKPLGLYNPGGIINQQFSSFIQKIMGGVQQNNQNTDYTNPKDVTFNLKDNIFDPNNVQYWNGSQFLTTSKDAFNKTPFNVGQLLGSDDINQQLEGQSIIDTQKSIQNQNIQEGTSILGEQTGTKQEEPWGSKSWQKDINQAGNILSSFYDAIPTRDKTINGNDEMSQGIRKTAEQTLLQSGDPITMGIGAGLTALDKTGGFTDASKGLGGATDTANFIGSLALPGAGFFTKRTTKYNKDQNVEQSSGYQGFKSGDEASAEKNSNAKLLFGRGKANSLIQNAIRERNQISDILNTSELEQNAIAGSSDIWNQNRQMSLLGGYNFKTQAAKNGIKLPSKEDLQNIKTILSKLKNGGNITENKETIIKPEKLEGVFKFKNGGQLNVIPEGALHARLNKMDNVENITKKGIPVLDNGGEQQAEIEKNEIIFRKEVTDKLEELEKDGSDKAALEAGKLLTYEIFENTDDRTGLIEKAQQGTKLDIKQPEQFNEQDIMNRLTKDYPILNNIKFRIISDPNYSKEKTGEGSIEYLPQNEDKVTYSNGYSWTKPKEYKEQAVILFNPNESNYEDVKLDALHVLRDQDPNYSNILQQLKNNISDDYYHAAKERFNQDKLKAQKSNTPFNDTLDHYLNNEVDGFVRNMLFDSDDPAVLKAHNYAPKQELIKYNQSMIPYIDQIKKYIQSTNQPPIKENGGKLDNKEKKVLLSLLMEKTND